jgi:hypothetical protein
VSHGLRGVTLLALCLAASSLRAQDVEPRREEIFKMVDAYVLSNLQESLALSDEQFVKLLPLVKKVQSDRRTYTLGRAQALGEMRRLLESGTATDARLAELMRDLKQREADWPALMRKNVDALDEQLTPVQQAKLRLLENRVEQRLRELVIRKGAQSGGAARPLRRDLPPTKDPAP